MRIFFNNLREQIYKLIEPRNGNIWGLIYDIVLAFIAFFSVIPLFFVNDAETFNSNFIQWIYTNDIVFVSIFMVDYFLRWLTADLRYGKGWKSFLIYPFTIWAIIDMLAIVPTLFGVRQLQALITLRLLRIIRFFPKLDNGFRFVFRSIFSEIRLLLVILISLFVIVFSSAILIYSVEKNAPDTEITSFFVALWFVFITITTIGYGDIVPVTVLGKIMVVIFSLIGIALIALVTATIVSGFNREFKRLKEKREENLDVYHNHYFMKSDSNFSSYGIQILFMEKDYKGIEEEAIKIKDLKPNVDLQINLNKDEDEDLMFVENEEI